MDAIAYRLAMGLDGDDQDEEKDFAADSANDNTDIKRRKTAASTNSTAQKSSARSRQNSNDINDFHTSS